MFTFRRLCEDEHFLFLQLPDIGFPIILQMISVENLMSSQGLASN